VIYVRSRRSIVTLGASSLFCALVFTLLAAGATQLLYKDLLNRLEAASPGSKLAFVKEFQRTGQPAFAAAPRDSPRDCEGCGMPAFGTLCAYCRLVDEVGRKIAARAGAPA